MTSQNGRVGGKSGRVTIAEVALSAGVSPTTVSHVLSGKRAVGASTKSLVHRAISELGYRPNQVARNLRTRRSDMVAVIIPDIVNPFYGVLTRGLADALAASGYGTYVCNTDGISDREMTFLQDVGDRGADGIVLASTDPATKPGKGPADMGTPVVCVGGALDHPRVDLVAPDDEVGSRSAIAHLVARGARRIAMIQGPRNTGTARVHGYRRALADAHLPFDASLLVRGAWTRESGRTAMRSLLKVDQRPDGVFCANDLMAIGAMDLAREVGLSVPDDIAVVGFDDVEAASMVHPALTTVQNPAYETGRVAADLLLSRMSQSYTGEGRTVVLPCQLVIRDSA